MFRLSATKAEIVTHEYFWQFANFGFSRVDHSKTLQLWKLPNKFFTPISIPTSSKLPRSFTVHFHFFVGEKVSLACGALTNRKEIVDKMKFENFPSANFSSAA